MPQVPLQWGEWRPDLATLDSQFAFDVENVLPGSNSYLPLPDLVPFTDSIVPPPPSSDPIVGLTQARTTAGDWKIYAGTKDKLFEWKFAGWVDVTRTTGGGYHVPGGDLWSFSQFGKWLVAVQLGDVPQAIDVDGGAGTTFANLGGSPPVARNVRTIGDFLLLAGLASNLRKVIWSGINDSTAWTIGLNLCDEQEFPDGGPVMGVCGDKVGYAVQDRAVRLMQFLPGDTTYIWSISKVVYDRGGISKNGFCCIGDVLYLLCEDGFYSLAGSQLMPIGHEKVNEWFLAHSDVARRDVVQAIVAVKPYIIWPFHATSGSSSRFYDSAMIYNHLNQRWSRGKVSAQMWATVASVNLDLDTTGPEPGDDLLDSTAHELDSFAYQGGRPRVVAINPSGYLCELAGPNLEALLETPEVHPVPGKRALVGNVYPVADAAEGVIYNGYRERLQDDVVWTQAYPIEITGSAAVWNSSRLHRFRHVIPRGSVWTHAQGVLAEVDQDGTVA